MELSCGQPFSPRIGDFKFVDMTRLAPPGICRGGHWASGRSGYTVSSWLTLRVKGDCVFPTPQLSAVFTVLWISRVWGHQNPGLKSSLWDELTAALHTRMFPALLCPVILMPRSSSSLCTVPEGFPCLMYFCSSSWELGRKPSFSYHLTPDSVQDPHCHLRLWTRCHSFFFSRCHSWGKNRKKNNFYIVSTL